MLSFLVTTIMLKNTKLQEKTNYLDTNCLVFSSFNDIEYKKITDHYEMNIPPYLRKWLIALFRMLNTVDMNNETPTFNWMVLIYPSLLLIKEFVSDQTLVNLTNKTIITLRNFMNREAKIYKLSLNDVLICIELHGHSLPSYIPEYVWNQLNSLLESATTLNKYLKITCQRHKHIELIKNLLNYNLSTTNHKFRNNWILLITPYTQICRLNRLLQMQEYQIYFTTKSKRNVIKLCNIFNKEYNTILKQFIKLLKNKSDNVQRYYAYYRYKTMAMCTHTNTTMPPTFAGYIGCSVSDANFDVTLLKCVINALIDDVDLFRKTTKEIISNLKNKNIEINIQNVKKQISADKMDNLKLLDHISFHSICIQLMFKSISRHNKITGIYYKKLMQIRYQMRSILDELASHSLLFSSRITCFDDILQNEFLTDVNETKCWMAHLMSGVLLNFWSTKQTIQNQYGSFEKKITT